MGLSLPHLILIALVVLLLFGRGKISELMGDFGKGVKSFKDGISDESSQTSHPTASHQTNQPATPPPPQIAGPSAETRAPTLNGEPLPHEHR